MKTTAMVVMTVIGNLGTAAGAVAGEVVLRKEGVALCEIRGTGE